MSFDWFLRDELAHKQKRMWLLAECGPELPKDFVYSRHINKDRICRLISTDPRDSECIKHPRIVPLYEGGSYWVGSGTEMKLAGYRWIVEVLP